MRDSQQATGILRVSLFFSLLIALTGCGGGGSSDNGADTAVASVSSSTFVTWKNTPGTGHFHATIASGRNPTYIIVENGEKGTAAVTDHAAGEFTYTPEQDAEGSDFFTFKVNDGVGDSELAVVSVTILPSQTGPLAADDAASTSEDTPVTIDVLENDLINDGTLDPASVTVTSMPMHGDASANTDGTVTYTPEANYPGPSDSFTYTVKDEAGNTSNVATATISIAAVNDAPAARDDEFTTDEDNTTTLAVLDDNGHGVDFDVDGDTILITTVGTPDKGGSVVITDDQNAITYTPAPNFFGQEVFTYTISDGNGGSDTATVTVTVVNVNDAPDAINDRFTVSPNSSDNVLYVISDNGNGPDWDIENDPLTVTATGTPNEGGDVRVNTSKDALVYSPAADFVGRESFTYTISDGNGGSDTATVTVDIEFADHFGSGMDSWTIVDDSGKASSWTVTGGKLRQQTRVQNGPNGYNESFHQGTYAYYPDGVSLTDYRFSVDAVFLGSVLADDIGIMFRYQDNGNYYRLSMNSRFGFTRLEKKINGAFITLAVTSRGYEAGQLINFSVDLKGPLIQIFVNDEPLFAINDTSLASGSVALYTQDAASFDNVVIEGRGLTPSITLAAPAAGAVLTGNSLTATAIATNVPAGGRVEFLLDGTTSIFDDSAPYSAVFEDVAQGDRTIEAIIRDAGNVELARDTNNLIGAQGDYYVAVGDSIVNGSGDNYASDNETDRILGFQGYQANLAELLEESQRKPVMVYNEGIGGDESVDLAFSRIDSILARHPESNEILVMIGTNDALAQIPSGSGCAGDACDGTFKGNMRALIDTLSSAGKAIHIGLVPPVFGTSDSTFPTPETASLNTDFVQEYNTVITSELTGYQVGPDLYDYFLGAGENRFSLFADVWHPNALGHAVMASLWHNALNPGNPVSLPFVLDELTPSTAFPYLKQNLLEVGDAYYVDAPDYTLTDYPEILNDGRWIMTANADRDDDTSSYITFETDRAVTVYIAYDAGATSLPDWMSDFSDTWQTVGTTDPSSPVLKLYSRTYSAGAITLGGNLAAGASGANSGYVAIVVPH